MKKFLSKENFSTSWNYLMSLLSKKQDSLPNGEAGQILTKTDEGFEWQTPEIPEGKPENLLLDSYGYALSQPIYLATPLEVNEGDLFSIKHFILSRKYVGAVYFSAYSADGTKLGTSTNNDVLRIIKSGTLSYIQSTSVTAEGNSLYSFILVKGEVAPTEWYPNPADYLTKAKLFDSYLDGYGAEQDQTFGEFLHAMKLPDDGSEGQVLTKTETGVEWKDSSSKEEKVFYIKCDESIQNGSYVCQVTNTSEEIKEIVSYAAENSNYKIIVQNGVGSNLTPSTVFYNKSRKTLIISSSQSNIPSNKFIDADNKYDEYSCDLVYYITLYESGEYDANLYRESVVRKFRYIELDSDTQLSSLDGYFVNSSVGEIHYIIKNTSSNTIVITLPSNGEIKYSNVEQIEIEPGSVSEINIIFTSRQKFIRAV